MAMTGVTLALIAIHLLGGIARSRVHRENLILAMFTGVKKVHH